MLIALSSGAASQLVIDATAFVALCTENEHAAEFANFFGEGFSLLVVEGQRRRGALFSAASESGEGFGGEVFVSGFGFFDFGVLHASAEQDIDAASSHIGGDGDRTLSAGFGYDQGLSLVEFRV